MKKLSTLFFALLTSVGTIFAESGTCGANLSWDLTNGVLTISGTGTMYDFSSYHDVPWYSNRENISQIDIHNGITYIGNYAFFECANLSSVTIPNSVTIIGYNVFKGCTGLTSPVYNDYVFAYMPIAYTGAYTIPSGIESIANGAFSGCSGLTSITFPSSVTSIGGGAFLGCSSLTSVTIPNSVTSIGSGVFDVCRSLKSLTILNTDVTIDRNLVYGCHELTAIVAPASALEADKEEDWVNFTHSLQSVTFTNGELTYNVLGVLARSYKTLTTLDISGVSNTELEDEAFKGFYNLQSLVLPANLTKIGYMAVADCKNLQSIDIPASVTEISQSAFENCRSLKTITFGGQASSAPGRFNALASSNSQLQRIGNWAFYNCHELQNLEIPEGVIEIGDGAFYGCTYLENLTLPASVQSIGDNTFALCAKMKKIVVNAVTPPSIQAKTFFDVKRQIPVYVPDESISAYLDDPQWSEFNIQGISHMPEALEQTPSDQPSSMTHKLLRNGQILILRGDRTYTVTGQELR